MTNHLAKNHKFSDLFRHLQVGQTECRKRRIWVGRVKLYISALRLEDGELLLVVSPRFNASAIRDYALRWEIETLFSCLKGRGFNHFIDVYNASLQISISIIVKFLS